jgi:uncharacterized repeat protein (TIGR01451 family)
MLVSAVLLALPAGASANQANLSAGVSGPVKAAANTNAAYSIAVQNGGQDAAQTLSLTAPVPANSTFVSFTAPAGWTSMTPAVGGTGTVSATIASLPAGATAGFTLVVHLNSGLANGTTITDQASVASATPDPNSQNNTSTATTTVSNGADLSIVVADSPDPVAANGLLTYTLTAYNDGPLNASSVGVMNPVPASTSFVSMTTPAGWTTTTPPVGGTGTVSTTNPTVTAGTTATFTLVVQTVGSGPFTDTASIGAATADPNPANNASTAQTNLPLIANPVKPRAPKKKCKKAKKRSAGAAKKRCKKKR